MITKDDILRIWLTDTAIWIQLKDDRQAKELFSDYPGLRHATDAERNQYSVSRFGLHWPHLDEDLSFSGFFR